MRRALLLAVVYLAPLAVLALFAALASGHGRIPYQAPSTADWDHVRYLAMAEQPFGDSVAMRDPPFAWRVLAPLLVRALPIPAVQGFEFTTILALAGATLSLAWALGGLGASRTSVALGAVSFVLLGPATGFTLWDYLLVDPVSFALLAFSIACAVHRRGPLLVVSLMALAATKETAILGAYFALALALERRDRRQILWAAGGVVGCLAMLLGLRWAIPVGEEYRFLAEFQRIYLPLSPQVLASRLTYATAGTWGPLLPIACLQLFDRPRVWRRLSFLGMLGLATAQVLVSVNVERVVVYAFPVMIAAVALECGYLARKHAIPEWACWVPVLLVELLWAAHFSELATISLKIPIAVTAILTVILIGLRGFRPALRVSRRALGLPRQWSSRSAAQTAPSRPESESG